MLAVSSRSVVQRQSGKEQASPALPGEELATQGDTCLGVKPSKKAVSCRIEPNDVLALARRAAI
jgi:hypothetical protein